MNLGPSIFILDGSNPLQFLSTGFFIFFLSSQGKSIQSASLFFTLFISLALSNFMIPEPISLYISLGCLVILSDIHAQ